MKKRERGQQPAQAPMSFVEVLEARIAPAVFTSLSGTVLTISSDNAADVIELRVDSSGGGTDNQIQFQVNGGGYTNDLDPAGGTQTLTVSAATRIDVNLGGGDDILVIHHDGSTGTGRFFGNAFGGVGLSVNLDGGGGHDLLEQTGNPGANLSSDTYTVGPDAGAGTHYLIDGPFTKGLLVSFQNLAPVLDFMPGPLTVNATNASNAINFALNTISVDGFETIQILNKTNVTINALAGDDTININNPTGLSGGITVSGGGPTASDTLIVNGTNGADTIGVSSLTTDGATITIAGLPTVTATTIEHLIINGQGGGDKLTVTTPAGSNLITYTPGATQDSASVQVESFVPISFTNLGLGGGQSVTLADAGAVRVDTLVYNGTDNLDLFTVDSGGIVRLNSQVDVSTPGVSQLRLNGMGGLDLFSVAGNHPFSDGFVISGGDPSEANTVIYFGTGAGETINLDLTGILSSNVDINGGNDVTMFGIQNLDVQGNGGTDTFAVTGVGTTSDLHLLSLTGAGASVLALHGTALGDTFAFSPGAAGAGSVQAQAGPLITYSGLGGIFTLDGGSGGVDTLQVAGTAGNDDSEFELTLGGDLLVTLNGVATTFDSSIFATVERASILGGAGNDRFLIDSSNGLVPFSQEINFDGGLGSDLLVLYSTDGPPVPPLATSDTYTPGPNGSGTSTIVMGATTQTVTFENLEPVIDLVPSATFVFNGGVGNDVINYTVGPNSGVVSFVNPTGDVTGLITADGFESAEFLNKTVVTINGRVGNDTINLHDATTPNLLTGITVNGGDGDDVITTNGGLSVPVTFDGGLGNDLLDASGTTAGAILNGREGNDTLYGGSGNDTMDGGAGDDVFVGNGGTDNVGGGTSNSIGDTILLPGTTGNDTFSMALDGSGHLLATINGVTTTYQNFAGGQIATSGIEHIEVQGRAGNDALTVTDTNGAISIPINFDGGDNADSLTLTGGTATSDTYTAGPNAGQGISTIVIGGVSQVVTFANLEPVIDNVAGPLVVNANNASNAINFAGNVISVDAFETIAIANKTNVTINALAGDDTININNPTGLSGSVTVNGGDPTGSDTVIVNGTAGVDTVNIGSFTADGATITGLSSTIIVTTTENLTYSGQGGADALTITTPAGGQVITLVPGAVAGAGSIAIRDFTGGGGSSLLPLIFTGINATGTLSLNDIGGGRVDDLSIAGTAASNNFDVSSAGVVSLATFAAGGTTNLTLIPVLTPGVAFLELLGLDGDDVFNIAAANPFTGGILIDAGNPSANDTVNLSGAAGAIALSLAGETITGYGGTIGLSGVEVLNLSATGGAATLTITGTAGPDSLTYTPTGAAAGNVADAGLNLAVTFSGVAGALTIDPLGGNDTITVVGTNAGETIGVDASVGTITVGAFKTLTFSTANTDSLIVQGLAGSDIFNVTAGSVPVLIDGGDPIGLLPGDHINISGASTYNIGPLVDQGSFSGPNQPVSFVHIESVTVLGGGGGGGGGPAIINGTNGNDAITIIARDGSYDAAANGVRDFTASVNVGPEVLFINFAALQVNALSGDDVIDLQAPAPNGAVWDVAVTIDGGAPGGSDKLIVETPGSGAETVNYTPNATNGGVLDIASITSPITITDVEQLVYEGRGDNDVITIFGTVGDDTIVATPGAVFDSGAIQVNNLLAFNYQNIGGTASLTVNAGAGRNDTLVVNGTAASDTFGVSAAGVVTLNANRPFNTAGVENVTLEGYAGDDTFNIAFGHPFTSILVDGGDPSHSDIVNLTGDGTTVTAAIGGATQTVTGGGLGSVSLTGVEIANINAAGGNLTLQGTASDDTISITPLGLNNGTAQANNISPVVNFSNTGTLTADLLGGNDKLAVNGGATADTFTLTGSTVSLTTLGGPRESVVYANAEQVTINGLDGADSLTVDSTGGAVSLPGGVLFDGGTANDTLTLLGGTAISDTYAAGPAPGSGTSTIVFAGPITQVVNFINLEPVIDLVAGPLTILGNAANNAINYSVGSDATRGLVTIDTQESIEFSNKTALTINAGAGSDSINLNNPNTPTGFTGSITVNGGDPATDTDTLLINGVAATVTVAQATSTITGAAGTGGATGISYTGIERLTVAAGTSSALAITGSANYIYTPGVAFDAGTIATDTMPVAFSGYGAGKTLSVTGIGAADILIVNGTGNDDIFTVAAGTGAVSLQNRATIAGTGIESLVMQGMDGTDTFNVNAPQFYNSISISGGNPATSDVANLNGDGTAITATIGGPSTTVTGGGLAVVSVSLTDVEHINVNAGVGNINVNGTSVPNAITVTPNGTFTSAITVAGSTSELDTNNTGLLTINEGTPGDGDLLTINGTTAIDLIAVTRGADTTVLVNALKLIHVNAPNIEALVIAAGLGDDLVKVSGSGGPALTVDAGAPNASDTLEIDGDAGANVFTVTPGATNDSGSVTLGADVTQFIGVEKVTLDGGGGADTATILGNGSNNAVAVNAVSASSMTVGIDTRALVTVANFSAGSTLNVNPRDGDDTVSVNPSGASNFTINVDEGGPVGSDTLVVEGTVLADAIGYTPSATVPADGVIVVNSVTTNFFGSEAVTINGLGGVDTFTANGLATDDSIVVTPAGNLGGALKVNGSTPVNFANMENVTIDAQAGRNDTITFNATINNDAAVITGTSMTLNGQLFTLANNENIVANLGDGDDTATVAGAAGVAIAVNGGDPSASDKLTYNGAGAAITFDFGAQTITEAGLGAVTITGIEVANVNAVAAAIAVNGTSGPDVIEVTPTTANTATIHVLGLAPILNTNNTSTLTIAEGTAGDADEVLVDGTVGSDTIGIVRGADTTVTVNALKVVHLTSANVESLVVAAAYGNDTINVSGSGGPALSVDGGLNTTSDVLTITNTAGGTTTVTPGTGNDSGFVENADGSVSFAAIESLKINGTGVGDTLVVLGTDDTDQMALQNVAGVNRATLNHQVPVNFASFGTVTLDGGFGDDKISVSPVGLTTVTTINVIGGDPTASDQLIVNGTAAADTFTFAPTGGDSGAITITGAPVVNYTTVETPVLSGLAGDDTFKIGAATGNVKIVGSTGSDTIDFSASTSGVTFDMDLVNQIQRVGLGDETVTIGDPIENFMGSSFNDFVHAAAMPFARTINGGAPLGLAGNTPATPVPPGDKLVIDAKNENITTVNVAGTGSVTPTSYAPINFVSIETLRIENAASGGPGSGGGTGAGGVFNDHSYTLSVHYPTGKQPTSVATGDVNGDGRPDIVETDGKSNSIAVLLNNGNGTFAPAVNYSLGPLAKSSNAVVLGDFDGNGTLDAAVANKKSNNVSIMTNTGGGIFALASTISMGASGKAPLTLAVGNLNAGGDLDLVVANQQSNKLSVLLGGAGMSFGAPTSFATGGINLVDVKLADINGDGILDAVTANEQSRNISLLMGTGTGTFTAPFLFAAGNDPAALVAGDLNGDGKADVAVANGGSGYATILINNGLGGFLPQAQAHYKEAQLPATMMLADISNDGKLDLITVNKNTHNVSVLLGVGNGTFDTQVDFAIGVPQDKTPAMMGLADFNGDGSLDIVVANSGTNFAGSVGLSVLLKNPTP